MTKFYTTVTKCRAFYIPSELAIGNSEIEYISQIILDVIK
jgi:hypothetical protein